VLLFFPFLVWLAAATSVTLMVMLAAAGELRVRSGLVAVTVFLVAAYCQFFTASAMSRAAGLALQTALAVALIVWWRLAE
jgi:hypothetical protein